MARQTRWSIGRAAFVALSLGACRDGGETSGPRQVIGELPSIQTSNELIPGVDSLKVEGFLRAIPASSHPQARRLFYKPMGGTGGVWFNLQGDPQLRALALAAFEGAPRGNGDPETLPTVTAKTFDAWSRPVWIYLGAPGGKVSVTVRNPGDQPRGPDAVFLPGDKANAEYLSAALRSLAELRLHASQRGNLKGARGTRYRDADREADLPSTWRTYLNSKLAELRKSPLRTVPGRGKVRAIEIRKMGA